MNQQQLEVEITFRDEEPRALHAKLEEAGATDIQEAQQKGIVGIGSLYLAILGLGGLVSLVYAIVRLWSCGVIVDARGAKVLIEKNCDLPRGTVLVISKDGTKSELHEPSAEQLNQLIKLAASSEA
jgi:hypothetical protein